MIALALFAFLTADPAKMQPVGVTASIAEAARLQKQHRDAIHYGRSVQRAYDAWQAGVTLFHCCGRLTSPGPPCAIPSTDQAKACRRATSSAV